MDKEVLFYLIKYCEEKDDDKRRVITRRFYQLISVIFLNTAKPTREQIKEKLFSPEFYLITDEEAFERYWFRKWIKDG